MEREGQEAGVARFRAMVRATGEYAARHAVFRIEELDAALGISARADRQRRSRVLRLLIRRAVLRRVARRTYAAGAEAFHTVASEPWRPRELAHVYAAAALMRGDGVIGYRSALELLGIVPPQLGGEVIVVGKAGGGRALRWGTVPVRTVKPPRNVALAGRSALGVSWVQCGDAQVPITGPARTFVDALHRPRLVGSWGDVLEALALLVCRHALDWRVVVTYVRRLECAATASRVGWLLEQGQHWNGVPEPVLVTLERFRAPGPIYWVWSDRWECRAQGVRFATRWRLMVRREVVDVVRGINRRMREGGVHVGT